jgi:hypothetical protein
MALMKHIKGTRVRVNKGKLNLTVEMIYFQCTKRFLSQRVSNKKLKNVLLVHYKIILIFLVKVQIQG